MNEKWNATNVFHGFSVRIRELFNQIPLKHNNIQPLWLHVSTAARCLREVSISTFLGVGERSSFPVLEYGTSPRIASIPTMHSLSYISLTIQFSTLLIVFTIDRYSIAQSRDGVGLPQSFRHFLAVGGWARCRNSSAVLYLVSGHRCSVKFSCFQAPIQPIGI